MPSVHGEEHRRRTDLTLELDSVPWAPDVPGIAAREAHVDGARWALLEYEPGARREEWCRDGHAGYVVSGAIEYEFDDDGPPLAAREGQAFPLSTGRGHPGRNTAERVTRLFLIDEPA